jgi:hypothetical protein
MAEDELGALLRGLYPPVIEGYTPNRGERILDRRNDQTVVDSYNEFQPWYAQSPQYQQMERIVNAPAPPVHTGNPMAKQLGYNDIHKPTPEEMAKFLADISEMDKQARTVGPDMSADDLKTMNDPIGKWLRRDQ